MVKVRIGRDEIVYSDEDLQKMNRMQLKQLKQDLQCNMEDVSAKKTMYKANNNEEKGSSEYYKQMAIYKMVIEKIKKSIAKVNVYEKSLCEEEKEDREHWLWMFYRNVKNKLNEDEFKDLIKLTDENVGYNINFGE